MFQLTILYNLCYTNRQNRDSDCADKLNLYAEIDLEDIFQVFLCI